MYVPLLQVGNANAAGQAYAGRAYGGYPNAECSVPTAPLQLTTPPPTHPGPAGLAGPSSKRSFVETQGLCRIGGTLRGHGGFCISARSVTKAACQNACTV